MYINKKKVTNWLAQHNFPLGMVYFSDGLSRDPLRQKTETLRNLVLNNSLKLTGAYGSAKDVPMYASLGLPASRIFMIGRVKTKYLSQAVALKDGYVSSDYASESQLGLPTRQWKRPAHTQEDHVHGEAKRSVHQLLCLLVFAAQ